MGTGVCLNDDMYYVYTLVDSPLSKGSFSSLYPLNMAHCLPYSKHSANICQISK